MLLTIDSSVWVAAFMGESHADKADTLVRECLRGAYQLITPIIVPPRSREHSRLQPGAWALGSGEFARTRRRNMGEKMQ